MGAESWSRRVRLIVLLLVLGSVLPPVLGAAATGTTSLSITHEPSATTVAPGDTATFTVEFNATGYDGPGIDLQLPAGWTLTDYSAPEATYKNDSNQWLWLTSGTKTLTYTVAVPPAATNGSYDVSVTGSGIEADSGTRHAVTTNATVTVATGASFRYRNLSLNTTSGTAPLIVNATATVRNTGPEAGTTTVPLLINNTTVASRNITLASGATRTIAFTHAFETPGTSTVGIATLPPTSVRVNGRPTATLDPSAVTTNVSEPVAISASASSDPDGDALTYTWDFDADGVYDDGTGSSVTTVFSTPGTYPVSVAVSDGQATATASATVSVVEPTTDDARITPFTDTVLLTSSQTTPEQLADHLRVEESVAQNLTVAARRQTTWNYSLGVTSPDAPRNVTVYLAVDAITAQPYENLTLTVDGEPATFTVNESAGATDRTWIGFTLPTTADTKISFTSTPLAITNVSLAEKTLTAGESTTVSATITNTGSQEATGTLSLTVDGASTATRPVTLAPGATTTVTFERPFTDAGTYELGVNGNRAGTVTVDASTTSAESPGFAILSAVTAIAILGGWLGHRRHTR